MKRYRRYRFWIEFTAGDEITFEDREDLEEKLFDTSHQIIEDAGLEQVAVGLYDVDNPELMV